MTDYTPEFYSAQQADSLRSARIVLPLLFSHYRPASVVDVGCGVGPWLKVCTELEINDIRGIDGSHVPIEFLMIPQHSFCPANLAETVVTDRQFGLAMSLEVAEHLPESRAWTFVKELTQLSKVVLFSAAIPYQGGTAHINENWPEYWATLFHGFGYEPLDFLRPRLWNNNEVCWWYRQNLIVFCEKDFISASGLSEACRDLQWPLSIVHPDMFLWGVARPGRVPASRYPHDARLRTAQVAAWQEGKVATPQQQHTYGAEFHDDFGGFAPLRRLKQLVGRFRR
ncbi:MAG: methyltransferase domain-containing protein [Candidatus Accumulibacter cognatus]|uniref:Methyltransferase domain-containing protein n=1 Tax=Candidatus Accumulibacter cognatus TaxID=2954383 RepID=A0A7D5N9W9_9PROT|nr:MAG: methyltransferase domain-containing protein [Candidatus Accumulibacter cognatus]